MSSDSNLKPIPTEYKGRVYRSKSEAIFARAMDLSKHGGPVEYEPKDHSHAWDFMWVHMCPCDYCRPLVVLIEYKPSKPTTTYIRNLIEKVRPSVPSRRMPALFDSYIVWGSPWKPWDPITTYACFPIFSRYERFGWGDFDPVKDHGSDEPWSLGHSVEAIFGITRDIAAEAAEYRFDLVNSPCEPLTTS